MKVSASERSRIKIEIPTAIGKNRVTGALDWNADGVMIEKWVGSIYIKQDDYYPKPIYASYQSSWGRSFEEIVGELPHEMLNYWMSIKWQ